jgi:hypothetical protein
MNRAAILVSILALLSMAGGKSTPFGVDGTVTSLNGNYFKMDANIPMMVFIDANTVFKIDGTKVSGIYVVKGTKVSVAGGSTLRGRMNAQLVDIIPDGKPVTGTVKQVGSGSFILECGESSVFKVHGGAFTKLILKMRRSQRWE